MSKTTTVPTINFGKIVIRCNQIWDKLEDIKNRPGKDVWKDLIEVVSLQAEFNTLRTILESAGYKFET